MRNWQHYFVAGRHAAWCYAAGVCLLLTPFAAPGQAPPDAPSSGVPSQQRSGSLAALQTVAEASDFQSTATYQEVVDFCESLAEQSPRVALSFFGESSEGKQLPLLVISDPAVAKPGDLKDSDRIVFFVMNNIHAGEVCGKEASLMWARQLAEESSGWLRDCVFVIAPIYNADGNDRMSPDNRPGQVGPANGMGQRHNGQDLDLNRDHMKLESPEARALASVVTRWNPHILVDTHTTNGSYHQYAITFDGPRHPATPGSITTFLRDKFLPDVSRQMESESGYRSFYYGNFDQDHKRWATYPDWPRYSTHYFGLRGRLGILSEAYAYLPYRDRVLATKNFLDACTVMAVRHRAEILSTLEEAARIARASGGEVPIRSSMTSLPRRFEVLGYVERERTPAEKKDAPPWGPTTKATKKTKTYQNVEFLGATKAERAVTKPYAYLIPAAAEAAIDNLRNHGIQLHELREDVTLPVERYRIKDVQRSEQEYQGHRAVTLAVTSEKQDVVISAGTIVAKTNQPLSHLLVNLVEPESQDGLVAWNYFDDAAQEGAIFPVLRLPDEQPLLLTALSNQRHRTRLRVTAADYLDGAPQFSGRPTSSLRWWGNELVDKRGENWYSIKAKSGKTSIVVQTSAIRKALLGLPDMDEAAAKRIMQRLPRGMDARGQSAIVAYDGELYGLRLREPAAQRLTFTAEEEELPTLSPDQSLVAFVRDFNLYTLDPVRRIEYPLTAAGDRIRRYGKADWVYFEEVYRRNWKGYQFSPDSSYLALVEYDDSPVLDFRVIDHTTPRTVVETERYPKAGDPIPRVRLGVTRATGGGVQWADFSRYSSDNMILTRYGWLPDSSGLYALVQNRAQTWMDFNRVDIKTGKVTHLFRETGEKWVSDPGPLWFLSDGSFVVKSEKDGWSHLYRISADGKNGLAVTSGEWEVRQVLKVNDEHAYFMGTKDSHLEEHLYHVRLSDGEIQRLTNAPGRHRVLLSDDLSMFVDSYSNPTQPTRKVLRASDGSWERTLDSNPVRALEQYELAPSERFEIELSGNYRMPCVMTKPFDFSPDKKYPVWIMTYGGPHAPTVSNSWGGRSLAYDQMLASMGIIALHCDPRSASGQGAQSTWVAYQQLGVTETQDLEEAVDWLVAQGYVDADRIGLSGHSYGGFLTAFAMTHSDKFAAGIAGAPVTDWRNYDAFYTERYMNTPQENPDGYEATSVVAAARNLHGRLLLIHGAKDDNVHVQNTLQLARKLQEANKDFEMMIYPNSRHGIGGDHYKHLRVNFIRRTMLGSQ